MRLYLLTSLYKGYSYDTTEGIVIAARSPKAARLLASKQCGDEGASLWMSRETSTCKLLAKESTISKERVVLIDYRNG